jgi:YHS domain-containing protein
MARNYTTDPICGRKLEAGSGGWARSFRGREYYFCSRTCATVFEAFPATYAERKDLDDAQRPADAADPKTSSRRERQ